jgi:hypothetical protein
MVRMTTPAIPDESVRTLEAYRLLPILSATRMMHDC